MTRTLYSMIPDPDRVLALPPEELAGVLLEHINSLPPNELFHLNRYNFFLLSFGVGSFKDYPEAKQEEVAAAFREAWQWLEREGLLLPTGSGDSFTLSRKAEGMNSSSQVDAYRHRLALPALHPKIDQLVRPVFLRARYDDAVREAFKQVEIAVREAGGFTAEDIGRPLMRNAFDPEKGRLRDAALPGGERGAMANLFDGAIGVFKNPQSHRDVALDDPVAVTELLMFASYLLRVVDARR